MILVCQSDKMYDRLERELLIEACTWEVFQLPTYERELVKLYITLGSYRKIESETGIAWETAYCTIKKSLSLIKEKVEAKDYKHPQKFIEVNNN